CGDLDEALALLSSEPFSRSAAVAYRPGTIELLRGHEGELDVELADRYGLDGLHYTPRVEEASSLVDRGDADLALLLRAPRVGDVFSAARRGERTPPESTYL